MWSAFTGMISRWCTPDEAALAAARIHFKETRLPKGTYFIREGSVCTGLSFIYKGLLRSFYINDNGEEVTSCFSMEGNMETSFESFIAATPSALSIVAMEDTELLSIEKKDLNLLLEKYIFWNRLSRILTEQEYLKMTRHATANQTEPAQVKYCNILKEHPCLLQRVPLHYIASYLGISSRHLTRLRKSLTGH